MAEIFESPENKIPDFFEDVFVLPKMLTYKMPNITDHDKVIALILLNNRQECNYLGKNNYSKVKGIEYIKTEYLSNFQIKLKPYKCELFSDCFTVSLFPAEKLVSASLYVGLSFPKDRDLRNSFANKIIGCDHDVFRDNKNLITVYKLIKRIRNKNKQYSESFLPEQDNQISFFNSPFFLPENGNYCLQIQIENDGYGFQERPIGIHRISLKNEPSFLKDTKPYENYLTVLARKEARDFNN
jgi:hypothetical protein